MLNLLDDLIRKILMDGVSRLLEKPVRIPGRRPPNPPVPPKPPLTETQIGFGPPDEHWVSSVKTSQLNALNVYLVDLRENRKLRSNERTQETQINVLQEGTEVEAKWNSRYLSND